MPSIADIIHDSEDVPAQRRLSVADGSRQVELVIQLLTGLSVHSMHMSKCF